MTNKIAFIADFFVEDIKGGAEIYDQILIDLFRNANIKVVTFRSQAITAKHIDLYRKSGFHFIVSNFTMLSEAKKEALIRYPESYSILEHDHKYIIERDPSNYQAFKVPPSRIINRMFYASAKNVFAQSKIHAEVIELNLKINNIVNLGMSLWSEDQLEIIEASFDNPKTDDVSIVNSTNPTKNTHAAVTRCQSQNIPFTLIGSSDYSEFIEQLSSHTAYMYIPKVLESFNRVLLEARMLNVRVITTNLNGCISEDWFQKFKGKQLIEFVRRSRTIVFDKIKENIFNERHVNDSVTDSDITVILNAYRRPYNLKMQIDAIRNQTNPPKQIWVWVNYHEDNKDFDFKSLAADRVFHNDHNWKFYGRFAAALLADTEFIAIYDDDTIPGAKWHENCLSTMKTHEGILGTAGVILRGNKYVLHDRCGWPTQNDEVTPVDLVGHGWFFKREWLKYLWLEKPTTWDNGEDIQFAFMAQIHGGIQTYCPPHPAADKELHGSFLGYELGIDSKATSNNQQVTHQQFFIERDMCIQTGLQNGWQTVHAVKL